MGETQHYHPLVGFGNYANWLEKHLNFKYHTFYISKLLGFIAVLLAVSPFILFIIFLINHLNAYLVYVVELFILYFCIGMHSLKKHALDIYQSLTQANLADSQAKIALIVSRDTNKMNSKDISRATIESLLENGSDAIFAPIFCYLIAGAPGVLCYRLINTLDAMWGYKTPQFIHFGYSAAKLDDLLNYLPARLTALSYALMGNWQDAIHCWKTQTKHWIGINPGVVMATGSGALGVKLGGGDYYHGEYINRAKLGLGKETEAKDINSAIQLIHRVLYLWLVLLLTIAILPTIL